MRKYTKTDDTNSATAVMYVADFQKGLLIIAVILMAIFYSSTSIAQKHIEAVGDQADTAAFLPSTYQGQNLDLAAVLSVFQNSKGLEDFENELNKEDGVNNLDLNGDSIVDYIRVMEKEEGEYRVIVMQAIIGENEFQDVAYINIKKSSDQNIEVEAQGNTIIYGDNYYVSPEPSVRVRVYAWPVWTYIYVPNYRYYHSPYYWGYYPKYYRRYYYVYYDYYYTRVYVYHTGYYYYRSPVVIYPKKIYTPRNSNRIYTTPPVAIGQRGPRTTNTTVSQPGSRVSKPGAPSTVNRRSLGEQPRTGEAANSPQARPPAQQRSTPAAKPGQPARAQESRQQNKQASQARPAKQSTRPEVRPAKSAARPAKPAAKPAARPAAKPAKKTELSKSAPKKTTSREANPARR